MSQAQIDSFVEVQECIVSQRRVLLDVLIAHGPLTTFEAVRLHDGFRIMQPRARIHELWKSGLVEPVGKRKCSVTGYQNTVWKAKGGGA